MKKIIIFILFSVSLFAQNKLIYQRQMTDSLDARQVAIQANSKNFIKDSLDIVRASIDTTFVAAENKTSINFRHLVSGATSGVTVGDKFYIDNVSLKEVL